MAGITDFTNIFNLVGSPIDIFLNVILPIPIVAYAIYLLLGHVRIFSSQTARGLIGIVMAASLVLIFRLGAFALWAGIAGIFLLKIKNWPGRLGALVLFFLIITQVTNLTAASVNPQTILLLVFFGFALLTFASVDDLKKQLVMIILIFAIYFVLIWFVIPQLRI